MSWYIRFLMVAALWISAGCSHEPNTLVEGDIAFVDVNVLPMDSERLLLNHTVVIAEGRIVALGSADDVRPAEGVEVVQASGQYLMPGLVEMHGHLPNSRVSDVDVQNLLFLYVANGITTVRGMQGDQSQFDLRRRIDQGQLLGPQLFLASTSMNGTRVPTPEQAEQLVREYKIKGYDLVKIHEGLTPETFDAMVRIAKEVEIPFGGHVSDRVGLHRALDAGQLSIDHLDNYVQALVPPEEQPKGPLGPRGPGGHRPRMLEGVDESLISDVVQATVDAGAWVVPTMVLWETAFFGDRSAAEVLLDRPEVKYMPPETVERWTQAIDGRLAATDVEVNRQVAALRRKLLGALYVGGANIALGTDSPQIFNVPGFSIHHEMALYIDIGMTPYDVLEVGTRKPAEYFAATDDFGTVAIGQRADLILLTDNPLHDIANVMKRVGVMVKGKWLPEEKLQQRLDRVESFYGG